MRRGRESSDLAAALGAIHRRAADACARARRDPAAVRVVAVSKTVPADRVRALLDLGHSLFGENRVQEALGKIEAVGARARWHLVGHLQRNKARHAVGIFDLIHSVDGLELAREIDRRAAARGLVQPVLVQVNVASEASKHGAAQPAVPSLVEALLALRHLSVQGFMCIPPPVEDPEAARGWFRALRETRDRLANRLGAPFPELSMGMTDDFEVAIEEGATLVRIGRALFGDRPPD